MMRLGFNLLLIGLAIATLAFLDDPAIDQDAQAELAAARDHAQGLARENQLLRLQCLSLMGLSANGAPLKPPLHPRL